MTRTRSPPDLTYEPTMPHGSRRARSRRAAQYAAAEEQAEAAAQEQTAEDSASRKR